MPLRVNGKVRRQSQGTTTAIWTSAEIEPKALGGKMYGKMIESQAGENVHNFNPST